MPDETRHESADLDDYSVQEPADSLTGQPGEPGDDPLDRGIAPPERWSSVIRTGSDAGEQESLDQLLAEEEPDTSLLDTDDELEPQLGLGRALKFLEDAYACLRDLFQSLGKIVFEGEIHFRRVLREHMTARVVGIARRSRLGVDLGG